MNQMDPSKAIRAKEIVPLIEKRFDVVERKDWGGTLLHLGLQNIVGKLSEHDPTDPSFLSFIIFLEGILIEERSSEATLLSWSPRPNTGGSRGEPAGKRRPVR